MHSIQNKFSFPLEVKFTNRSKTIGFRIKDNKVIISAPAAINGNLLEEIIDKKSDWINRKLSNISPSKKQELYFLGKKITIKNTKSELILKDNIIYLPENLSKNILLKNWYNLQARKLIKPRAEYLAQKTKLIPQEIDFKFYKSQWGNCNRHKKITLNISLIMCPQQVIDYVIIHELCHLKQMNHSDKFWHLVENHHPQYKNSIKILKKFTPLTDFN